MQSRLDYDRVRRTGAPEVLYGEGKSKPLFEEAWQQQLERLDYGLASRVPPAYVSDVNEVGTDYCNVSRLLTSGVFPGPQLEGPITVVTAGTSDLPIALEVVGILEFLKVPVTLISDVGVAGLHRLLEVLPDIELGRLTIAVAGMEGALPTVLSGLSSKLVIGLPTSVGYGSHQQGEVALRSMLASCSPGVVTVGIDNGVGAALAAYKLLVSCEAQR